MLDTISLVTKILVMARPIEPTLPLEGEDAARLLAELSTGASSAEMSRRIAKAKDLRAEMMRPKGYAPRPATTLTGNGSPRRS